MASELYIWVVQKVKYDSSKTEVKPPYPLPRAIAAVLAATKISNNMLVSPGYLGNSQNTTNRLYPEFDSLMSQLGRGNNWPLADIGFMRTMNTKSGNLYKGFHEEALHERNHCLSYGPRVSLSAKWPDHRKMILFYSVQAGKREAFSSLVRESAALEDCEAEKLLDVICVNAIAMGSSNFNLSTYFGGLSDRFTHGEADIILFAHEENSKHADFSRIINSFDALAGAGQSSETFLGGIDEDNLLSTSSIFSQAQYYPNKALGVDAHTYLQRVAEEVIRGVCVPSGRTRD